MYSKKKTGPKHNLLAANDALKLANRENSD